MRPEAGGSVDLNCRPGGAPVFIGWQGCSYGAALLFAVRARSTKSKTSLRDCFDSIFPRTCIRQRHPIQVLNRHCSFVSLEGCCRRWLDKPRRLRRRPGWRLDGRFATTTSAAWPGGMICAAPAGLLWSQLVEPAPGSARQGGTVAAFVRVQTWPASPAQGGGPPALMGMVLEKRHRPSSRPEQPPAGHSSRCNPAEVGGWWRHGSPGL